MKQFEGFPARMEFTPIPNIFFTTLLPRISDMAELKTTLHALAALYRKRGYPRFITSREMSGDAALMSSLGEAAEPPGEALRRALGMAVERGTFIHVELDGDEGSEDVYFMNTASDRQVAARVQNGELKLSGLKAAGRVYAAPEKQPDIFTLYEENIGMLTPMIAEEMRDAEKTYPEGWISEAIKEAVNQNKRKWGYISAILKHWSTEGKGDGTRRRDSKTDPDKYIKGKYGHVVRR